MHLITSTELQRRLAHYRKIADYQPVMISDHGTPRTVMISAGLFKELMALKGQETQPVGSICFTFLSETLGKHDPVGEMILGDHFAKMERLFTLVPISKTSFEIAGFIFQISKGRIAEITPCPWIQTEENHGYRSSMSCKIRGLFRPSEDLWDGPPNQDDLYDLSFVPAILALIDDMGRVYEWLAEHIYHSVIWDDDIPGLKKSFYEAVPAMTARNHDALTTAYPDLNITDFKRIFGVA